MTRNGKQGHIMLYTRYAVYEGNVRTTRISRISRTRRIS